MTAPAWGSAAVGGFNWCLVVIPSGLWSKNPGPVTVPVPAGRGQKNSAILNKNNKWIILATEQSKSRGPFYFDAVLRFHEHLQFPICSLRSILASLIVSAYPFPPPPLLI